MRLLSPIIKGKDLVSDQLLKISVSIAYVESVITGWYSKTEKVVREICHLGLGRCGDINGLWEERMQNGSEEKVADWH